MASADADDRLWDRLAKGGAVLLMAHASPLPARQQPPPDAAGQCVTRGFLSGEGQRQAQRLRAQLQQRQITVGRVLTGHDCRSIETAALAFDRAEPWSILDSTRIDNQETARQRRLALHEAISRWSYPHTLALVSQPDAIHNALDVVLQPGELLVIEPLGDAGFRILGRVRLQRSNL